MTRRSLAVGQSWEARAAQYLADRGLRIIERGYRCRLGELDLVCQENEHLVIVEVKARKLASRASARECINTRKQQRILLATRHYLMRHPAWHSASIRFDVVAIDGIDGEQPSFEWIRHAFTAY